MHVAIWGSSDDNLCFSVDGKDDEVGCFQSGDDLYHATLRVATIGVTRGVLVHALYDGTWSFAIGKLEESRGIPPWRFDVGSKHTYSTLLGIDTGDDLVEVVEVKRDKKHDWTPVKKGD